MGLSAVIFDNPSMMIARSLSRPHFRARKLRGQPRGQAAVETAIVMPLFVFTLLGMIQLGLLHQTRLLTKYAAYKAVRAGSINRGEVKTMENAAIAVMLPTLSRSSPLYSGSGTKQPQHWPYKASSGTEFATGYSEVQGQRNNMAFGKKMVEVTICAPTTNKGFNKDFDDHRVNPGDWKSFEATKLAIQVTTYAPLYIPFANAFIWWAAHGQEGSARVQTMKMLRMKSRPQDTQARTAPNGSWTLQELKSQAEQGNYIMPVRASYSMRMHSNFKTQPPSTNECHIPWKKK
jgi:Flp pilus assembly protein TadG